MDVINQLKEAGFAHKAVVVTAALDTQRAARFMKAGVKDVALKPYTYLGLAAFLNFESEK
jgi:response regulator of citrate/malate metabolism